MCIYLSFAAYNQLVMFTTFKLNILARPFSVINLHSQIYAFYFYFAFSEKRISIDACEYAACLYHLFILPVQRMKYDVKL